MPSIIEKDGQWCLDGYGDADKCYASEDEAKAAQMKLMDKAYKAEDPCMSAAMDELKAAHPEMAMDQMTAIAMEKCGKSNKAEEEMPPAAESTSETEAVESEEATVDVPASIRKLVLNIGAQAAKAFGRKADDEATGFKVAGNHWLATWSNNFKDRDGELFPAQAMDAYASRVDMGITPLPELWVWHAGKQVAVGSAHWVGTHDHFLMAAGEFYGSPAAQSAKAYYTRHYKDTGISHGFTYPADQFDGTVYHQFNTFEISLLPRGAEANWYTSLEGVKAMALDDKKIKYLKDVFGAEHATRILADWEARGKALEQLGVEFKDFTAPASGTATVSAKAVNSADKSLKDLFPDLMEGSAEAVTASLEAVKAVKELRTQYAEAMKQIDALRSEMDLRPRSASRATETKVKDAELLETVKQQFAKTDEFWGTTVSDVPGSNGKR